MKRIIIAVLLCWMLACCGCSGVTSTKETPSACEKEGCSEPIYKYNLCTDHYVESELAMERCSMADCSRQTYKDNLCAEHYVEKELAQSSSESEKNSEPEMEIAETPELTEAPTSIPEPTNTPVPTSTPSPSPTSTPKPTTTPKSTATPTPNPLLTAEDIYEMAIKSVVEITGKTSSGTSTGTGFFSDKNGTVITNYHVIDGCNSAKVTLSNGTTYEVKKVLGYDEDRDIAILSIDCYSSVPLTIRATDVKTGENVYAIGSSLGLEGSFSNGIVSTAKREVEGNIYIQTTAPISHGNSGGPLLDKEGHVVGITTASFVDGQNLNLAIPIADVNKISTKNPITLAELFKPDVERLSEWEFFYYDEDESYVFVFHLADKDKNPIIASGTVKLNITNDDGKVVYESVSGFSENDYEGWTVDGTKNLNLVTLYIKPGKIKKGETSKGIVSFTVYGDDYSFEKTEIEVSNLPKEPTVEWISDRDFFYLEEEECYALVFMLADKDEELIRTSGTVELSITNDDGVVVYEGKGDFTEDFYENWTYGNSTKKTLVTFYLDPEDIDLGTTSKGTVSFVVYGDNYYFEETKIEVSNLPTLPMEVYCNDLPFVTNEYSYNGSLSASATVTEILWEVVYGDSMLFTFCGEKTYDKNGSSGTNSCQFNWRLYDMDNYLVDSGWVYLSNLMVGDKFKKEAYAWYKIEEGKSYTLVLTEVE